jgi:hypothetical protein
MWLDHIAASSSKNVTQPEDHMNTSCDPHWQERSLVRKNACTCSKVAATQRRKGGCTLARRPSKHGNCATRYTSTKEARTSERSTGMQSIGSMANRVFD